MNVLSSNSKKNITTHIVCIVVFILFQVFTSISGKFGLAPFNGVATALQYGVCLILIQNDEKKGVRIAIFLMVVNGLITARAMMIKETLSVLPGVVNIVFYLTTIILIAQANQRREIENLTDMLTGVYNRKGLFKRLGEKADKKESFHLLYFTLDNFKAINDNYGPVFGDELLRNVSKKISSQIGASDIIARTGGTDFAVVVDGRVNASELADKILEAIKEKVSITINEAKIDCFVKSYAGIASYPEHSSDVNDVIIYADIAMVEAAQQKSEFAYIFEKNMAESMYRQIEVEKLIKEGLLLNYFYLVYQPQFSLGERKIRGFETLIRMKTPNGNFVSPSEFIPVAEKSDLILQIDSYVIKRAMKEFKKIVEDNPYLIISINVSAKNIGKFDFVESIAKLLNETQFPANNLEIEITEYCMLNSVDVTKANISELKKMGVKIALDDFGTGYTSLSYLAELPIDLLKIDKSLIDDIDNNVKRREFVQAIISMGHLMNCDVIAEGVELENQVDYLKNDGCDYVQGFVWSKPLDYEVAKQLAYDK